MAFFPKKPKGTMLPAQGGDALYDVAKNAVANQQATGGTLSPMGGQYGAYQGNQAANLASAPSGSTNQGALDQAMSKLLMGKQQQLGQAPGGQPGTYGAPPVGPAGSSVPSLPSQMIVGQSVFGKPPASQAPTGTQLPQNVASDFGQQGVPAKPPSAWDRMSSAVGNASNQINFNPAASLQMPPQPPVAPPVEPGLPTEQNPYIQNYLKSAFEEQSFDPTRDIMQQTLDRSLRRHGEQAASSGAVGAGVEGAAQDILRGHATNLAQAYEQHKQQQLGNKMNAANMVMQDEWGKLDRNQQELMAKLMYDQNRKLTMGENDTGMGTADMQMIAQLMANNKLSGEGQEFLQDLLSRRYGDEAVDSWKPRAAEAKKEREIQRWNTDFQKYQPWRGKGR